MLFAMDKSTYRMYIHSGSRTRREKEREDLLLSSLRIRGRLGVRHEQLANVAIILAGQRELILPQVARLITFGFGEDLAHFHVDARRVVCVDAHQFVDRLE